MEIGRISKSDYLAIHSWLRYHYGKASQCENKKCEGKSKNYHWAKKREKTYEWKRSHFKQLCVSCHAKYDCTEETRRKERDSNANTWKTICKSGHSFTEENTYIRPGNSWRSCRTCMTALRKDWKLKHKALTILGEGK